MSYTLEIDSQNSRFIISGDIDSILSNKRITLTFKRLNFKTSANNIFIPYEEKREIEGLNSLIDLFERYKIEILILSGKNNELKTYRDEIENFKVFSLKAKNIRNNEFKDNSGLVEDFDNFQKIVKIKLKRTLYELQLLSAFHMAFSQNSCNFSVPGAGKTSIVYAAYAYLKSLPLDNPKRVDKLIIIGPISSFRPWETEYYNCFGYETKSFRLSGNIETSREEKIEHLYSPEPDELTLIYPGGVDSLKDELIDFMTRNRTMLVVDEAHKIKNPDGVWGKSVTEISEKAIARVALTGTPVPNGYQDLFNIFKFIQPYKYKEVLGFSHSALEDLSNSNTLEASGRVERLKDNISPFFIRIKKEDLKLPKVEEELYQVEMLPYQREIYEFIEAKYINHFEKDSFATVKDILNKAKLIRLRQAATNPSLLTKPLKEAFEISNLPESNSSNSVFITDTNDYINDTDFFGKIIKYVDVEIPVKFIAALELLQNNIFLRKEKCIIWTIFIDNALQLSDYLLKKGIKSKLLIGQIEQSEREETITLFNNPQNHDFDVVIANPFSVAESISLHNGCHNAIYLERDYNCSNFLQSKDRIHRVGLNPNQITNYYYIIAKDSIDEVIHDRLEIKIERMERIINDEIPLFEAIDNGDETDIIKGLMKNYAERS